MAYASAPAERALLALAAPLLVAAFAPAEGVTYQLRLTEQRITARGQTEFVAERRLQFTREGDGYRAVVTIGPARAAGGPLAGLFLRGAQGLVGRTLVMHLDANGTVTAIDDLADHWRTYCDALAAPGTDAPLPAAVTAMIAGLRQASEPQQLRTLGTLVTSVIAGARETALDGDRPVRLPARDGAGMLDGQESVTRDPRGLTILTSATGPLARGDAQGRVALEREERIERGLVVRTRETRRLWPQGGDAEPSLTIISGGELSLAVK